jgi:hypothetical protein
VTVDLRFDLGDGASHFTVDERQATASHGFDEILDQGLVQIRRRRVRLAHLLPLPGHEEVTTFRTDM